VDHLAVRSVEVLAFDPVEIATGDGERLGAWWIPAQRPSLGHLLFCHGNAGNIGDRVHHARVLSAGGFDVLLFDYRGYGASTGKPDEQGTYTDARAALGTLLRRPGVDASRVFYLGESLGGAVALWLAVQSPPRGLILQSTFTSIRQAARRHYPFVPSPLVPDAYPSVRLIAGLRAPLLVLHGDRDDIVPLEHGQALFDAAPAPKRMRVFTGAGHSDLLARAGSRYVEEIAGWVRTTTG
jgi:pimeloyl-ACP methyl ester carboxylesterase